MTEKEHSHFKQFYVIIERQKSMVFTAWQRNWCAFMYDMHPFFGRNHTSYVWWHFRGHLNTRWTLCKQEREVGSKCSEFVICEVVCFFCKMFFFYFKNSSLYLPWPVWSINCVFKQQSLCVWETDRHCSVIFSAFFRYIPMFMRIFSLKLQACYDVREASVFWAKMSSSDSEFEWLSTHPSSETRQFVLESLMPVAIQLREKCKVRHIYGRILNTCCYWNKWF
jgi:hypothetical protein